MPPLGRSRHRQRLEENTTIRRPFKAAAPTKDGPRSNRDIRVPRVQLIDADGSNRGDVSINDALLAAEEAGLDLVEISPNAEPPVVKILDLGKLKYANQKKAAEARKNQKVIEIKEIKMRPNIDSHDYEVKMRAVKRFFDEGDKVKLTLRFRGREMAHLELGMQLSDQGPRGSGADRQGRSRAQARRPPDDDGAGAALRFTSAPCESATPRCCAFHNTSL